MNTRVGSSHLSRIGGAALLVLFALSLPGQPPTYDDLLTQAKSALTAKNYKGAVTATGRAISMDDRRWEAYAVAANAYSAQKLYDDAIGMLQMALPRTPEERKQLVRDALQEVRRQMTGAVVVAPVSPPPVSRPPSPPPPAAPTQAEIVLWKSIENSSKIVDFRAYLERYPDGTYSTLARQRIETLTPRPYWPDPESGLSWTLRDNGPMTWSEAAAYCGGLRLGGYGDWRLPSVDELARVYDPSVAAVQNDLLNGREVFRSSFQDAPRPKGPNKIRREIQLGDLGSVWGAATGDVFSFKSGKRSSVNLRARSEPRNLSLCVRPSVQ